MEGFLVPSDPPLEGSRGDLSRITTFVNRTLSVVENIGFENCLHAGGGGLSSDDYGMPFWTERFADRPRFNEDGARDIVSAANAYLLARHIYVSPPSPPPVRMLRLAKQRILGSRGTRAPAGRAVLDRERVLPVPGEAPADGGLGAHA